MDMNIGQTIKRLRFKGITPKDLRHRSTFGISIALAGDLTVVRPCGFAKPQGVYRSAYPLAGKTELTKQNRASRILQNARIFCDVAFRIE